MRVIGWIGMLHVFIITVWLGINVVFNIMNPITFETGKTIAENGIAYYSEFPGYLGFDHGSKAFVFTLSTLLPIGLFIYLKRLKQFDLLNIVALISGCLGFILTGLSLILQAVTVEYAFNLYNTQADEIARGFATHLYEWSMLEGGFSTSIYIIANLGIAIWIIIHSYGLAQLTNTKKLSLFGYIIGSGQIIGLFSAWFFLMQGKQSMHTFNEVIGFFIMIWLLLISIKMIRGKITV